MKRPFRRSYRAWAVIAASAAAIVVAGAVYLEQPWASRKATPAQGVSSPPSTSTPIDMYDMMGELTLHGRTIPSARLAPDEYGLVDWIDNTAHINEIRPAEGWPSANGSLSDSLRGAGVVHAILVPPSTVFYDVVPLGSAEAPSVCATSAGGQVATYSLSVAGRQVSFDYRDALYFATYRSALIITTDGDALSRLQQAGASAVSCGNNGA